jgi:hypothetical protein
MDGRRLEVERDEDGGPDQQSHERNQQSPIHQGPFSSRRRDLASGRAPSAARPPLCLAQPSMVHVDRVALASVS